MQINPTLILVKNIAAVLVTANLPPFAQPGTRIDITVAAIGDASNLQGGILILTPLKGADGQVYAAGQGSVVTAGFVAKRSGAGGGGASQTVNHPTAGRIPDGYKPEIRKRRNTTSSRREFRTSFGRRAACVQGQGR